MNIYMNIYSNLNLKDHDVKNLEINDSIMIKIIVEKNGKISLILY